MIRRFIFLLFVCVPFVLRAQADTIPFVVTNQIDWAKVKALAPKFQQKDLIVRIVRLNNLTSAFEREGSPAWQDDWHFMEITGDRYLDGIYSGKNKHHKGWFTYLSIGDSAMKFPIKLSAPGFVSTLRYNENEIEMILRDDPSEGEYVTEVAQYYYRHKVDSLGMKWKLRFVSTTEVPLLGNPDAHVLKMPIQLRTSPRDEREPTIDYDGDGKSDASGNIVAEFPKGARLLRYAVVRQGDLEWSFVAFRDAPSPSSVLKPVEGKGVFYAGWIPSASFTN